MQAQAARRRKITINFVAAAAMSLMSRTGAAQTTRSAADPDAVSSQPLTYEVVSVKPNKSGNGGMSVNFRPAIYSATNTTLPLLIQSAYGLRMDGLISGLPSWAQSTHFDIEAKTDDATASALEKLPHQQRFDRQEKMLRAVLEDRFHLKAHVETKDLPIYALVVTKGGFKLKPADPNDTYESAIKGFNGKPSAGMIMTNHGVMTTYATPIVALSANLTYQVHRIVVDQTGLTGKYDITLKWSPDDGTTDPSDSSSPSIFTALQEQLGLKLEPQKAPVETIVIDHVELPSEN